MTTRTETGAGPVIGSPWRDLAVPGVSLPEFLLAIAADQAERPAVIDAASGRMLRYGELADAMRRVAAGLAALGLRPGDVLAILAPNSPEWLVACFGAMAAGGVVTGINPLTPPARSRPSSPTPAPASS
jgi:acyl-CoA synthetase (AMP-forming)/AMP-acid ligase II